MVSRLSRRISSFQLIELAAEIFPLPLIHEGFVFRRPIVGGDLGSHAHSFDTWAGELKPKTALRAGVIASRPTPAQMELLARVSGAQKRGRQQP